MAIDTTTTREPVLHSHETQSVSVPLRATPAKRKLEEVAPDDGLVNTPPSKSLQTYLKDETHWLLDGNILFQIGNTRFKIHRSRIVSESCWFQALVDQRAGSIPDDPYEYQDEIDKALQSVEQVGGLDLFYLDFSDGPNAAQFGALLTAMQCGIDYVYDPPKFEVMDNIYEASSFFTMGRYNTFVETFLEKMFPDNWSSIKDSPSPFAARAVILAMNHKLNYILRHCYYDLARTHPLLIPLDDDRDHEGEEGLPVPKPSSSDLWGASTGIFCRLLNTQRYLTLAWETARQHLDYRCSDAACNATHRGNFAYKKVKDRYPFDPISGIKAILADGIDHNKYCVVAKAEVRKRLELELDNIWTGLKKWVDIR